MPRSVLWLRDFFEPQVVGYGRVKEASALMLSVGREINIENRSLLCRRCSWQGLAAELSTGLVRITHSDIYVYAYRCPACESFDLALKGKLLAFRARVAQAISPANQPAEDDGTVNSLRRN